MPGSACSSCCRASAARAAACSSRVRAASARSSTAAVPSSAAMRLARAGWPARSLSRATFEGIGLLLDFRERGFGLGDAGCRVRLRPLGGGDLLVQFGVPRPAGGKVRRRAARLRRRVPAARAASRAASSGGGVAALGRQDGDVLLGLGEFAFERREGGLRRLAGQLRGLFGLGHGQGGRRGRGGGRMLGAAADRARDAGQQLGGEFGRGVGQPFLAEVQPALAPVLVLRPGPRPWRSATARAVRLGGGVAAGPGPEFVRGGGLLGPQLDFRGEFLEGPQSGEQGRGFLCAGRPGRQHRTVRPSSSCCQAAGAAGLPRLREPGEPGLVGQPLLEHGAQGPQSPQRGPQGSLSRRSCRRRRRCRWPPGPASTRSARQVRGP